MSTENVENFRRVIAAFNVHARLRGRGRTSGATVDTEVTSTVRFEDAKIASMRSFVDRAEALAALDNTHVDRRGVG